MAINNGLLVNFLNVLTNDIAHGGYANATLNITLPNSYQNRIFTSVSSTSNYIYSCATPAGGYSKTGLNIDLYNTAQHQNINGTVFCIIFGS